ncbi:PREDICTED: U7 snRNA-associated Sm-like protein LSm10-like [Elephantulus edwardii]|uniref:U7 snRNA-associated Sm-like protein LSm10-like n=1 Tax=Elephantulus edwardii TaxID=28737 RepID=UPI0003F075D8|nr:PREDICTED: U7 snRNA-associated Sm-like protein LSm10-like [Elephantulus edwardii]
MNCLRQQPDLLLQALQGQITTVDLQDESTSLGRIDNVDAFMNIHLASVTYIECWGHRVELFDLFVTGCNVRYVHIPDAVNITATIEKQLQIIHWVWTLVAEATTNFPPKTLK